MRVILPARCGPPAGTLTPIYTYDGENRLLTAGGVTYTYDGDGKRVKKSNGTLYWTGVGSGPLAESDLSGNITAEYAFFNGARVARIDRPSGAVHFYVSDHLGSAKSIAVAATYNTATVAESDYLPYGGEIPISGSDPNHYKFTGKERDSESGLDNFGARYDSSSLGRFMTPDWAARPITVPYAKFGDPQSLNLYGYVRNDPVTLVDADGHKLCWNFVWCGEAAQEIDNKKSADSTPPPLPATLRPPGLTGVAKKAVLASLDNQKVGKTTLGKLEKTMSNEDRSLSGGKKGELNNGKVALANTIINNASLKNPHQVAPDTGTATDQDKQVMREAYFDRATGGDDPVEGRTYYGTSQEDLNSRPIGTGRQTVYDSFGTFDDSYSGSPTFIYIYNDPGP